MKNGGRWEWKKEKCRDGARSCLKEVGGARRATSAGIRARTYKHKQPVPSRQEPAGDFRILEFGETTDEFD